MIKNTIDVAKTNDILSGMSAVERIRWAHDNFGQGIVATTSGGRTSRLIPGIIKEALGFSVPTIFVDTGHYSKETYLFVDRMEAEGADIRYYQANMSRKRMEALHGNLWESEGKDFDRFLNITKHEPLSRAFHDLDASLWIRGIMGFQTSERAKTDIFEYRNGIYRLHPIVDWTHQEARQYLEENHLPVNDHHFDITKGPSGKLECKIGGAGRFSGGSGI